MKRKIINRKTIMILTMAMIVALLATPVTANLKLDNIMFDPAVIASGDEVDIVIQFHDTVSPLKSSKIGNPNYEFKVSLEPDDSLTEKYVILQDKKGDDLKGTILSGGNFNKKFRVKILNNAPAGNYQFKLTGQWYYKGEPESSKQYLKFKMPVKKEGIIMDIATLDTLPAEVRPGDENVKVSATITNTGEKDAKAIEINLDHPEGLEPSYTSNNRVWVGSLKARESKKATFFIDVDEHAEPGTHTIEYNIDYMDVDDNKYSVNKSLPFLIKGRPYLEITSYKGKGLAGSSSKLYITVNNTGSESAEAIDVRLLKQNSQPFNLDVRSDYIGELLPGEEGVAVFDIGVKREATIKEHTFKVLIRSKGDSDEGDDNIYTYSRRARFPVTGEARNNLLYAGLLGAVLVIGFFIASVFYKRKDKK